MENTFLLTLLLLWSCQIGIFSAVVLPNLSNETHGEDDNLLSETHGEDDYLLSETHGEDDYLLDETHGEDETDGKDGTQLMKAVDKNDEGKNWTSWASLNQMEKKQRKSENKEKTKYTAKKNGKTKKKKNKGKKKSDKKPSKNHIDNSKEEGNSFEGDMILNKEQLELLEGSDKNSSNRNARRNYKWPNGIVYFSIDSSVSKKDIFFNFYSSFVRSTLANLQTKLSRCITFQERNYGPRVNVVSRTKGDKTKCQSSVGYQGGVQDLELGGDMKNGCWRTGTIEHEFLHAIGIYHEQSRSDRDKYVTIQDGTNGTPDNIRPDKVHNFRNYHESIISHFGLPYNYYSVMHYGKTYFGIKDSNGKKKITIETKDPTKQNIIGQRDGVNDGDIQLIHRFYGCGEHVYAHSLGLDGGYWGSWGKKEYCPYPHFGSKMELKIESKGGDDTALNAIRLTCTNGKKITSAQSGWGTWRGVKSCSSNNYIKSARIRRESKQGSGDDTAANGVRFTCTDGAEHYPGDGYWGSWFSWKSCPSGSAVYGIETQIESSQGVGDDTALNNVVLYCAKYPACSGFSKQWDCCSPSSPCELGGGDCDSDSDCSGSLICGTDNCRSFNPLAHSKGDCCMKPHCISGKGESYGGTVSKTTSGYTCQKWSDQKPHSHSFFNIGDHNYCRNPNGQRTIWCYTTSSRKIWDFCTDSSCAGNVKKMVKKITNSTIGSTTSKTDVTKPPTTLSCKSSEKCTKKNGKCFGKGDTVPKNAKNKGWCNKKMKCKCYEV